MRPCSLAALEEIRKSNLVPMRADWVEKLALGGSWLDLNNAGRAVACSWKFDVDSQDGWGNNAHTPS